MPRSYRRIILPAVGLGTLAIGAGVYQASLWVNRPNPYPSYRESGNAQRGLPAQVQSPAAYIFTEKHPCLDSKGHDESELCAQWRATQAAEKAAMWAWWQMVFSLFGVIGLGATLAYNWIAIRLALSGQKDAERGLRASERSASAAARAARATNESNQIARETMQRQLRPHLYLSDQLVQFQRSPHGELMNYAPVSFTIKNYGQAPAKNVRFVANATIGGYWSDRKEPEGLADKAVVPLGDIAPGQERLRTGYAISGLEQGAGDIANGVNSIFLEGQIQYDDYFGETYFTNFQLAMTGSNMFSEPPSVTPHWNEAS